MCAEGWEDGEIYYGEAGLSTYQEKLRLPSWQKKRLQIMERDNWACLICADCGSCLQVHHKEYIYGREPWEYEDDNFMTLCEACHNLCHHTGTKTDLKEHIMSRFRWDGSGTITQFGLEYLFQHHLLGVH